MTEVKICGVCRPQDAAAAARAGATWIGVILAPGRTRSRSVVEAAAIFDAGGPARRVGVFVDEDPARVIDVAGELSLDAVQLHGTEPVADVYGMREAAGVQVWKALRIRSGADYERGLDAYAAAVDAVLLDGWSPRGEGGVGASFDWESIAALGGPAGMRRIVAGGLDPHNVARAVALLRPAIADVSSGVEDGPGRKSESKIRDFIAAVRGAGVDG